MSDHEPNSRTAHVAAETPAGSRALPYAALLVSSVVLGFELFRG
jgi:hypothetical protein